MFSRSSLCAEHKKSRPRKSTNDRDYGARHQAMRRGWAPIVAAGLAICPRCDGLIEPGTPWDLDHTDDRTGYLGPAHRTCNRREAARKKNRSQKMKPGTKPQTVKPTTKGNPLSGSPAGPAPK